MQAFNVYLGKRLIDTVFWNDRCDGGAQITEEDVKKSLVEHDGYDTRIEVCKQRRSSK